MLCSDNIGRVWDCASCLGHDKAELWRRRTVEARRTLGCGWLADRTGADLPPMLDPDYPASSAPKELRLCPGYLVRLPGVVDAAAAAEAAEAGLFAAAYPDPDQVEVEGAILVRRAHNAYQAAKAKERKRKADAARRAAA